MRLFKGLWSVRLGILTGISLLAVAGSASAVEFGLGVWQDGGYLGGVDAAALGCESTGDHTASCTGGGATFGDLSIDSWSMNVDEDPVVTGITAVTNNSLSTQTFTLIFTLAVAPPVVPSSLIGGSIAGTVTDNNGDGATLATAPGSAIYSARIDGATVATLYNDPTSAIAASFLSGTLAAISFGTPIPSLAGPPALSDIGIRLKFTLTPGDSASFTSNFVVLPIPEPGTAILLGLGLGWLGLCQRRPIR
jgi:hypothetical protein